MTSAGKGRHEQRVVIIARPGVMRDALEQLLLGDRSLDLAPSVDHLQSHPGGHDDAIDADVALIELPDGSGLAVVAQEHIGAWVDGDTEPIVAVIIGWDADPEDLMAVIRLARSLPCPPESRIDDPLTLLTDKETEVLALLCLGWSTASVAQALQISPHTLRTHVGRILEKLGVHLRREAVQLAQNVGLSATRAVVRA